MHSHSPAHALLRGDFSQETEPMSMILNESLTPHVKVKEQKEDSLDFVKKCWKDEGEG